MHKIRQKWSFPKIEQGEVAYFYETAYIAFDSYQVLVYSSR